MSPRRALKTALLGLLINAAFLPAAADAAVRATPLATFDTPVYATAPPDDPRRVFVVEKEGTIRFLRDGARVEAPFLDIRASVESEGEQGLLSLAFAPDYATSGRFYVYYTDVPTGARGDNNIVIEEFTRSADPDRADPSTRRRVLTIPHPDNTNHDGGQLMFGPDGRLWITTGDGGGQNDPDNSSQDPGSLLGKVLRVDPASGDVDVWASGLRNPFRASFDRATGDLTIGDVGGGRAEEINFEPAGTGAGLNFGWRCHEGFGQNPDLSSRCTVPNHRPPVLEQLHGSTGFCAIIGGYVVRDPALRELNGRYVYGDNCEPGIRSAVLARPRATDDRPVGLSIPGLSSFGEDSCGHIYATSLAGGTLYRLDGDTPPVPCADGAAGPPRITLSRSRVQRVLRKKGAVVAVRCNEACGFTASARMRIRGTKKRYALRKVSRLAGADQRVKVRLRLYSKGTRALRRAIARKRRATITVTIAARDSAGEASRRRATIRARR